MRVYLVLVAVLATLAMAQRRPHMPHMPHKPHMPHTPHQPHQPHRPHRSHSHRHGRHRNKNSHDDDDDDNDELPAAAPAPATLPGAGPPGVIPGPDGKPVNVQLGTVYMIRHAEHLDRSGRELDRASSERADCIARMFGPESGQNITKIIVPAHKTSRPPSLPLYFTPPSLQCNMCMGD